MARSGSDQVLALEGVVREALGRLSPAHVSVLAAHPDAVRSALAATAGVLATEYAAHPEVESITGDKPHVVTADQAAKQLAGHTREGEFEALLTSDELAARVGLKTRQSVHDWLKKGRIIGWRGAKRGYVFPTAQFDDRDRPIEGMERVVELFDDAYAAWIWLKAPRPSLDGAIPLRLMAKGEVDAVVDAIHGDLQGDFA